MPKARKNRPILHQLIGRNYLGPGNPVDDAPPVDEADAIAQTHDIAYQEIENQTLPSDEHLAAIGHADIEAVKSFGIQGLWDIATGDVRDGAVNLGSGAALLVKTGVERALGRAIYPPAKNSEPKMPKATSGSRVHKLQTSTVNPLEEAPGKVNRVVGYQRSNLLRAQKKLEQMINNPSVGADAMVEQSEKVVRMQKQYDQWKSAQEYHKQSADHRRLMDEISNFDNTQLETPPESRDQSRADDIGPDSQGGAGPSAAKQSRLETASEEPSETVIENPLNESANLNLENAMEPMQVDENVAVNQTPDEIALSALGIADNMEPVQQVIRSQGQRFEDGHIIIQTSSLFYSWGYNFTPLDIGDAGDANIKQKWVMTPLAYVPVDYLPFFMSPAQYDDLPREAEVVHVSCKVTPWGSRVAFTTNSETAKPATAQHVTVGISAIGLNTDPTFNWANRDVTESDTMVIGTHTVINTNKLKAKLWGINNASTMWDSVPTSFGAIRQLDSYGGPVLDDYMTAGTGTVEYIPTGWPNMEEKVNRFAFDAFKGKPIINYNYTPQNGLLKMKTKFAQHNRSDAGNKVYGHKGDTSPYVRKEYIQRDRTDGGNNGWKILAENQDAREYMVDSRKLIYDRMIETGHCVTDRRDFNHDSVVQPQLHIGMLPVQANSPGTSVGFVCAAAYWQIDREIKIKIDFGTAYPLKLGRTINPNITYFADGVDDKNQMQGTVRGKIPFQSPYQAT